MPQKRSIGKHAQALARRQAFLNECVPWKDEYSVVNGKEFEITRSTIAIAPVIYKMAVQTNAAIRKMIEGVKNGQD